MVSKEVATSIYGPSAAKSRRSRQPPAALLLIVARVVWWTRTRAACFSEGKLMNKRKLREDDVDLICRHREQMFREAGRSEEVLLTMTPHFREWVEPRLRDGTYFGFVLSEDELPIAGIGLMAIDWPPHPSHPAMDKRGYVLNVYVEPSYRKQGLAHVLMTLAENEFAKRGLQFAILHSTEMARTLYAELGWHGTTEMAKAISA
jgi:ribosomal protein S18 acetylase RimI-like enzyme